MKLWGGRMSKQTHSDVHQLSSSLSFDIRLYSEDIDGSLAWTAALARAGVLTDGERDVISQGLEDVRRSLEEGSWQPIPTDEDIHTVVERLLTDRIGPVAAKLHTGRSRNDQVATDFRLWVMRACDRMDESILELAQALVDSAEGGLEFAMPGYTHLRRAQPVTWGHWALSHFWPLTRDRGRFQRTRAIAGVLPLGSGALSGTAYPIDREALAEELGFGAVSSNSLDAVADRDFALEFLFSAALLGIHMSRLAEALILFSSAEFGFIQLDDAYVTGSSLMPQKRNPDPLELARGKSGRLIGHLAGLLTALKGTPSAYDRDLQEDKQPVFDAYDTLLLALPALAGTVRTLSLHPERMERAITPDLLATDLADYLVRKGVAFREAHEVVGKAALLADEKGVTLAELPYKALAELHGAFDSDLAQVFDVRSALEHRSSIGGTAPAAVRAQLSSARMMLSQRAVERG